MIISNYSKNAKDEIKMPDHANMWNPEYEALPREELRALQGERLRE